eukprot:6343797-Alexandrium_andersonii.AAC.1
MRPLQLRHRGAPPRPSEEDPGDGAGGCDPQLMTADEPPASTNCTRTAAPQAAMLMKDVDL